MRFAYCGLLLLIITACAQAPESSAQRFALWLAAGRREQVADYQANLRKHAVDQVVPMPQLLRSGRRWRRCSVEEFAVPPRKDWPAINATLVLVRDLKGAAILKQPQVVSAWRSEEFNHCEGGSPQSRHRRNNALDLVIADDDENVVRLCEYWRRHGAARRFGLGFYSTTKIHIDTSGFRTWGYDHSYGSSLCSKPNQRKGSNG
ncbi:MAG TPA: D-Ala-D-Ala carboxypeptidase family metallohydrolase [Lysobacter sp.]|nr:D-Ala-D-Ala carboxypeptidase family metallohydrolase [Lysobacter sp.]